VPRLPAALTAWQSDDFARVLKDEIESLDSGTLPLSQGTSQGGMVDDSDVTATVLTSKENEESIIAVVGVFFTEIVAGCSCGDEPEEINAHCLLQVRIDKASARARIHVISD
jgi:hypothetical protein